MGNKKAFETEKEIYDFWEKEKLFAADPASDKKPFSLLMPPPNLTGELHLGHAMQHAIMDAVARFKRLRRFDVLLLPGVDHAGIQFESTLNNRLAKEGLSKEKLGREKWLEKAWQFKDEIYKSFHEAWTVFGISADWSREVFTMDRERQQAVFEEFKAYWDAGLIYKGPYIVQWCPKDNTAIEDVEVEYEERKEKLYKVKYAIAGTSGKKFITVATARPETIFADVAIAVHPDDKRYKHLIGKDAYKPLATKSPGGNRVKIIKDRRVDQKFGTGALKITPGHDLLDYQIGHVDNNFPILTVIDKKGRMTGLAGELQGLRVEKAREEAVQKLRDLGSLESSEDYVHTVPVCERCGTVVEPLISEEWFLKTKEMAGGAIKIIEGNKIKFLPGNYKEILVDWLENIHDWCISRNLWWGHRIPVWYLEDERKVSFDSPGGGWKQDEQVLDTWFSSGLWPLSTLGWRGRNSKFETDRLSSKERNSKLLERYFPWDFEISAGEIKYLWIARMIMISGYLTDQEPFKTMFFHGMLRDLQGKKFSKSLGNGIEPQYLIDKWGVDSTRMTLYGYSVPGRDGRVSKNVLDERGKNFRNFATKIRNIAKFILELKPGDSNKTNEFYKTNETNIHPDDRWIREELEKTIKQVTKHLEAAELHLAVDEIYEFIWHKFADVYVEKSKGRRDEAQLVLEYILKNTLIILHPFMPFLTEELYQKFDKKQKSILLENWPS